MSPYTHPLVVTQAPSYQNYPSTIVTDTAPANVPSTAPFSVSGHSLDHLIHTCVANVQTTAPNFIPPLFLSATASTAPATLTSVATTDVPLPDTSSAPVSHHSTTPLPIPNFMLKKLQNFMTNRLNLTHKIRNEVQTTYPVLDPSTLSPNHISISIPTPNAIEPDLHPIFTNDLNLPPTTTPTLSPPPAHTLPQPQFGIGQNKTILENATPNEQNDPKNNRLNLEELSVRPKQKSTNTKSGSSKTKRYGSHFTSNKNRKVNNLLSDIESTSDFESDCQGEKMNQQILHQIKDTGITQTSTKGL